VIDNLLIEFNLSLICFLEDEIILVKLIDSQDDVFFIKTLLGIIINHSKLMK